MAWPVGLIQGVVTPSQGSCSVVGPGSNLSCDLGTMLPGSEATVTIAYTVSAFTSGGNATMTVSVSSDATDPSAIDDTASHTVLVVPDGLVVPDTSRRIELPPRPGQSRPAFEPWMIALVLLAVGLGTFGADRRLRRR